MGSKGHARSGTALPARDGAAFDGEPYPPAKYLRKILRASTAHDVPQGASVSHRASPLAAL